jgi:hypothetical protein
MSPKTDLGSGRINLIEMAQQTAMSCKEKRDKRASARLSGLTQQIEADFASLQDRVNLPGNVVANLWKPDGFLQLCASYPNKFIPTISFKLMSPDPMS